MSAGPAGGGILVLSYANYSWSTSGRGALLFRAERDRTPREMPRDGSPPGAFHTPEAQTP